MAQRQLFKDMALQLTPRLLVKAIEKLELQKKLLFWWPPLVIPVRLP